ATPTLPEPTVDAHRARATVLVVEENLTVLALVKRTLESRSYRVLTASSADDAVRIAQREKARIDLVLTDTVMPQMTGKVLVEHLRTDHPQIKALYSCGYRADLVTQHPPPAAAEHYIQKPFTPTALVDRIQGVLHSEDGGKRAP